MNSRGDKPWAVDYGYLIEDEIAHIGRVIKTQVQISSAFEPRWLAIKLLEGDLDLAERLEHIDGGDDVLKAIQASLVRLTPNIPNGVEIAIADSRYEFISRIVADTLSFSGSGASLSERVDRVVTNPWLGFPIFLIVMYLVFNLVVNASAPYLDWIDAVISGPITSWVSSLLLLMNAPSWLQGLLLDGIVAGVGGVLVFVPGLIALFLFIGILEDSGYMARAAFIMHRLMGRIGLSGKSFVALILGFGCAVPAIYATRTLETFRERVLTGLLVPLMSCAARLPVYVVFGIAFFGKDADVVVWSLYALGVIVAAFSAWVLSHTILRQTEPENTFLLELPSYRVPSVRSLWIYISQRTAGFLRNAGTVILAASIVIWFLLNQPSGVENLRRSWFGELSAVIAPALVPAGFGNWETSGSLVTGLVAKEVVVSTMSQIYTGGETQRETAPIGVRQGLLEIGGGFITASREAAIATLETTIPFLNLEAGGDDPGVSTELGVALQQEFTPLSALAFLVFVLLYIPCIATLATIRDEFGFEWAILSACYQTAIAWIMAVAVFQIGSLLGYA